MAEFASVIALSSLNGTTGFRINGVQGGFSGGDLAGFSVSAGDVNGDGFSDLIIGANAFDTGGGGQFSAGATYVVFGKATGLGPVIELSSLSASSVARLDGTIAGDYSGYSVSSAGDFNGDGIDDLIIGAQKADPGAVNAAGSSYVVFGRATGFGANFALSSLTGANGFRLDGVAADDRSGYSVSNAGDVNGDGFDDVVIGAVYADPAGNRSGASYVVFGTNANLGPSFKLSALSGGNGFKLTGAAAEDQSGHSVNSAGDINGDGFDDVIVGAYLADPGGRTGAGTSYVVFGRANFAVSTISLSSLTNATGFRIEGNDGAAGGEQSGSSVASAGDVNGDRFDDLIIGSPRADHGGFQAGSAYVVFGKAASFGSGLNVSTLNGTNGFRIDGIGEGGFQDYAGLAVDTAGDVNGDGFMDLIIGAYFDSLPGRARAGTSYVVFGKVSGFGSAIDLAALNGVNGFRLDGVAAEDRSGRAVSSAGDVNGDGFGDIIVGAYKASPGGRTYAGSSFVVFGRMPDTAVSRIGSSADQRILGGNFNDTISGLAGDDMLDGLGGNDLLDGGTGSDTMRGGAGNDTYVVDRLGDLVVEAPGAGSDLISTIISYSLPANVEALFLAGAAPIVGVGNTLGNILSGNVNANRLEGRDGNDILRGNAGNDTLWGGNHNDTLTGGAGRDSMTGGAWNDRFVFLAVSESPAGAQRDIITDFNAGTPTTVVDRIDLSAIDANAIAANQQDLLFIGTGAFALNTPGRLRYQHIAGNTHIFANTDNDTAAELEILLSGIVTPNAQDFIL